MITFDIVPKNWKLNPIGKTNLAIRFLKEKLEEGEDSVHIDDCFLAFHFDKSGQEEKFLSALEVIVNSNSAINERYFNTLQTINKIS